MTAQDRTYTGNDNGAKTAQEATTTAYGRALAALVQELGLTVSASNEIRKVETTDGFESKAVELVVAKGETITVEHHEIVAKHVVPNPNKGFDACVRVSISKAEYQRLRRSVDNLTVLVTVCAGEVYPNGLCPARLVTSFKDAATNAGCKLAPQSLNGNEAASAGKLAERSGATSAIRVRLSAKFSSEVEGEFFAYADASVEKLSAEDGRILDAVQLGPFKGGHFSRDRAIEQAGLAATARIVEVISQGL